MERKIILKAVQPATKATSTSTPSTLATIGIIEPTLVLSKDPTNKALITVRSRALVESKESLPLIAIKFVRFAIAQIYRKGEGLETYRIDLMHFRKALRSSRTDIYTMGKVIIRDCLADVIELPTATGCILYPWFIKAEHYKGTSFIDVQFHPEFKTHLLKQESKFLLNDQYYIMGLKSVHSIKIYDLLKSDEGLTRKIISVADLKRTLGLGRKYKEFHDFKLYILDFAQRELERETDIKFAYDLIREGRRITKIKFEIRTNKKVIDMVIAEREKSRSELGGCKYPLIREFLWKAWSEYSRQSITRKDEKNFTEAADLLGKFRENNDIQYSSGHSGMQIEELVRFLITSIDRDKGEFTPSSGWLKNMGRLKKYLKWYGVVESDDEDDGDVVISN